MNKSQKLNQACEEVKPKVVTVKVVFFNKNKDFGEVELPNGEKAFLNGDAFEDEKNKAKAKPGTSMKVEIIKVKKDFDLVKKGELSVFRVFKF